MSRLINLILGVLCAYLLGAYFRAKQCQQEWDNALPPKIYFWTERVPAWKPEEKTSNFEKDNFSIVTMVTKPDAQASTTKASQPARQALTTMKKTTDHGTYTIGAEIPLITKFVDPSKPPRCFKAFGKKWK